MPEHTGDMLLVAQVGCTVKNDLIPFSSFSSYLQWLLACNSTFDVRFVSWGRENAMGFFFGGNMSYMLLAYKL
jgi:hypothetical protein